MSSDGAYTRASEDEDTDLVSEAERASTVFIWDKTVTSVDLAGYHLLYSKERGTWKVYDGDDVDATLIDEIVGFRFRSAREIIDYLHDLPEENP